MLTCVFVSQSLCALVFGKEEHGSFEFSQEIIENSLANTQAQLSGVLSRYMPNLQAHWFRPVVHLCISDINKALLVRSSNLLPLLIEALFLDPAHERKDVNDRTAPADSLRAAKAPIQTDAIDCLLQLALFAPGHA
jgi:hypothetical protein